MKKVLVITYYWPPAGGAGVQRWLKFVKYMRHFGWEPVVYTALDGEMPVIDKSLEKDLPPDITVIRRPIWEPYSIYKAFSGRKKNDRINASFLTENKKPGLAEKISVWLRGNFFIPDARRFWIKPSVRFLSGKLRELGIRHVISTGPPHSMHMIALGLKRMDPGLKWVADFRDPWTNIDFYDKLMLSPAADRAHHRMELDVLAQADLVVSIGKTMSEEFSAMLAKSAGRSSRKFRVITNGFDAADLMPGDVQKDEKFSLAHIGTLVKDRNPDVLWEALKELTATDEAFRAALEIKLVGKVDLFVKEQLETFGLAPFVRYIDYLPHDEVISEQRRSKVLLLLVNNTRNAKGIVTGKLFEYLATGVPVLAVGPVDGEVAEILAETSAGMISGFDDVDGLKEHLLTLFSGQAPVSDVAAIARYSRHELTKVLCGMLDEL